MSQETSGPRPNHQAPRPAPELAALRAAETGLDASQFDSTGAERRPNNHHTRAEADRDNYYVDTRVNVVARARRALAELDAAGEPPRADVQVAADAASKPRLRDRLRGVLRRG